MYKNMIRTSIFNLTSMDIDILTKTSEGFEGRISLILSPEKVFVTVSKTFLADGSSSYPPIASSEQ